MKQTKGSGRRRDAYRHDQPVRKAGSRVAARNAAGNDQAEIILGAQKTSSMVQRSATAPANSTSVMHSRIGEIVDEIVRIPEVATEQEPAFEPFCFVRFRGNRTQL
ncbi:hypothetical protein GCM10007937_41550 [Mesorhizobium albiziae]|nr:hypothetical protein [Mesorhizobium albiziae]GLS32445.1 hypothetical protein GCM10007937_41550 [Mesorhizobium albiziae]